MDMTDYFERRLGKLTVADLKGLLGEPRVVTLEDDGDDYRHALNIFYGLGVVSDPDWDGGDQHDHVLHCSEYGPPEHRMPDESLNLFFIIQHGVVIGMRTLFP